MQTKPLALRPYQVEGADELYQKLTSNPAHGALLADEMGVGKTATAIEVANRLNPQTILVVAPASLQLNWKHELKMWLRISADVEVISYGRVVNGHQQRSEYGLIIFDESHFLKSPKAKRTKSSLALKADYRLFLTGTPIPNKPIEAFNVLKALGLKMSYRGYGLRYCNGHLVRVPNRGGRGFRKAYDFNGASNLGELNASLRKNVMVRRRKADVLDELPPKVRQVIAMNFKSGESESFRKRFSSLGEAADILEETKRIPFNEVAIERHNIALAKLPHVMEFIDDLLESGVEKIAVFAHHRDVVEALAAGKDRVVVYGGMSAKEKDDAVSAFQHGDARVFVGNILAAGVGLTLTAANVCVFAEETWTPGDLLQAEDRLHRLGQKDTVQVYHIVADGSLDARIVKALIHKQTVIERVMA